MFRNLKADPKFSRCQEKGKLHILTCFFVNNCFAVQLVPMSVMVYATTASTSKVCLILGLVYSLYEKKQHSFIGRKSFVLTIMTFDTHFELS